MKRLVERFINYVKMDTQSDESNDSCPSTEKQFDLARVLEGELKELGLKDVEVDENCYVMATLPANTDKNVPIIGFIAHMDTATEITGANVNPIITENFDGKELLMNSKKKTFFPVKEFPEILNFVGETIITTDGTTLLGADDKAGVAEIMTAIEYLMEHPEIKHGTIKVAFTPDEEIGRGADKFDVEKFAADFAFTVDGGEVGELEYENFNAATAKIMLSGRNVHPGKAKNRMVNSLSIAMELISMVPPNQSPEFTELYEGFFHLLSINGSVESTSIQYMVRDHDRDKFEDKKDLLLRIIDLINQKHGKNTATVIMKDQYYNMKEKIEPVIHIIELAKNAFTEVGVKPIINPIRGGTDGAKLSFKGLPTPNIFTGGYNGHSRYEFIPVGSMQKAVDVILKIIELNHEGL